MDHQDNTTPVVDPAAPVDPVVDAPVVDAPEAPAEEGAEAPAEAPAEAHEADAAPVEGDAPEAPAAEEGEHHDSDDVAAV